jgi:hypothetical protein
MIKEDVSGRYASFEEFEAAKLEIVYGVDYCEDTTPDHNGMRGKQYSTMKNGSFFQVTNTDFWITEFWSTKHPESRYYKHPEYQPVREVCINEKGAKQPDYLKEVFEAIEKANREMKKYGVTLIWKFKITPYAQ